MTPSVMPVYFPSEIYLQPHRPDERVAATGDGARVDDVLQVGLDAEEWGDLKLVKQLDRELEPCGQLRVVVAQAGVVGAKADSVVGAEGQRPGPGDAAADVLPERRDARIGVGILQVACDPAPVVV